MAPAGAHASAKASLVGMRAHFVRFSVFSSQQSYDENQYNLYDEQEMI